MIKTYFNPFPELITKQYKLRQLDINDDNEIFILRSDEDVIKYLGRPPAEEIADAHKFITKINNGISSGECIYWAITLKTINKLIGTICLWNIDKKEYKAEIGFELLPEYMGKGIMQEVVPLIIDFGFNRMNLKSIEGEVDPGNIKSIKLMERFGFIYNRKLKDTVVYSLYKYDNSK